MSGVHNAPRWYMRTRRKETERRNEPRGMYNKCLLPLKKESLRNYIVGPDIEIANKRVVTAAAAGALAASIGSARPKQKTIIVREVAARDCVGPAYV